MKYSRACWNFNAHCPKIVRLNSEQNGNLYEIFFSSLTKKIHWAGRMLFGQPCRIYFCTKSAKKNNFFESLLQSLSLIMPLFRQVICSFENTKKSISLKARKVLYWIKKICFLTFFVKLIPSTRRIQFWQHQPKTSGFKFDKYYYLLFIFFQKFSLVS